MDGSDQQSSANKGAGTPGFWQRLFRRRLVVATIIAIVLVIGWWSSAYPRGMIIAWIDGARGHQEIKTFGLPSPWAGRYAQLIRERYGVEINQVAMCVVTDSLVWYVHGYNSVARPRIVAQHGKDIFAECSQEARAAWELIREQNNRLYQQGADTGENTTIPQR